MKVMSFEEFKEVIGDLESIGLIKVENDNILVDNRVTINFILESISSFIRRIKKLNDISKFTGLSGEELILMCIAYGLLSKIVSSRINMGLTIEEANKVDMEYLMKMLIVYMTIIERTDVYRRILTSMQTLKNMYTKTTGKQNS